MEYCQRDIGALFEHSPKTRWGGVNWIDLIPDQVRWRAFVHTVIKLWAPYVWEFLD
jgi:hypothetical protein